MLASSTRLWWFVGCHYWPARRRNGTVVAAEQIQLYISHPVEEKVAKNLVPILLISCRAYLATMMGLKAVWNL